MVAEPQFKENCFQFSVSLRFIRSEVMVCDGFQSHRLVLCLHFCDMQANRHPSLETADIVFFIHPSLPFHLFIRWISCFLALSLFLSFFIVSHVSIYLFQRRLLEAHTHMHTLLFFFPSFHLFSSFLLFHVCGCSIPVSVATITRIACGCACERGGGSHSDIWL